MHGPPQLYLMMVNGVKAEVPPYGPWYTTDALQCAWKCAGQLNGARRKGRKAGRWQVWLLTGYNGKIPLYVPVTAPEGGTTPYPENTQ